MVAIFTALMSTMTVAAKKPSKKIRSDSQGTPLFRGRGQPKDVGLLNGVAAQEPHPVDGIYESLSKASTGAAST
jgi:hypothetical protein